MAWAANARMYAPTPAAADAWRQLFDWVAETSGVPLTVIEHAAPQPLASLWRRTDLGAGMMCGFPWATWNEPHVPRPLPLAAPIPAPDAFGRQPVYWTDIVVRSDSAATSIADLAGARFAYTQVDSQSGYQAPRALFAHAAIAVGGSLFAGLRLARRDIGFHAGFDEAAGDHQPDAARAACHQRSLALYVEQVAHVSR